MNFELKPGTLLVDFGQVNIMQAMEVLILKLMNQSIYGDQTRRKKV